MVSSFHTVAVVHRSGFRQGCEAYLLALTAYSLYLMSACKRLDRLWNTFVDREGAMTAGSPGSSSWYEVEGAGILKKPGSGLFPPCRLEPRGCSMVLWSLASLRHDDTCEWDPRIVRHRLVVAKWKVPTCQRPLRVARSWWKVAAGTVSCPGCFTTTWLTPSSCWRPSSETQEACVGLRLNMRAWMNESIE